MKNLLLLVVGLLTLNTSANAQCKELKEKKDSFSEKKERTARVIIGNLLTKWQVDFSQSEDANSMKWGIAMQGEFNRTFEEGTLMLFKLKSGDVLRLKTSEPTSPVTQATSGGAGTVNIFTVYYLKFNLDKETLEKFANFPITDFKVDVPGQEIKNPKIKENQMENLQGVFKCMMARS